MMTKEKLKRWRGSWFLPVDNQKVHFWGVSNTKPNVLQSVKNAKNDWSNNGRKKRFILGQNAIFGL